MKTYVIQWTSRYGGLQECNGELLQVESSFPSSLNTTQVKSSHKYMDDDPLW